MWQTYLQPTTFDEALALLSEHAGQARIVAGGTDVLVELQRGVKPTSILIDITKLPDLKYMRLSGGYMHMGALATHNDVIASELCVRHALPLAQACWEVGAPQIRTRATVAGNLITASPANDTITPLLALDAEVVLVSQAGERVVSLREFYPAFRRAGIRPDELLREIRFPALSDNQRGLFIKLGLRRAQAISVIDLAIVLRFAEQEPPRGYPTENREPAEDGAVLGSQFSVLPIVEARIALGCLAPTVVRAPAAEAFLVGKTLDAQTCAEAGRLACTDVSPIDDVRGTASYRLATLANLVADGLRRIAEGRERDGWPERPVLLGTPAAPRTKNQEPLQPFSTVGSRFSVLDSSISTVETVINGIPTRLAGDAHTKSLLDALREDAGLTGTKEGCAEGECGACTVWLNGQAVMACLTPAGQAHGAAITTIEGLAATTKDEGPMANESGSDSSSVLRPSSPEGLHPLQAAFIRNAAVQCGYCIPGMLMAGAKLLEEQAQPDLDQIQVALSGNICRCTGYRKILDAVLDAAREYPEISIQNSG
jgi:carbon-monoxide dehydrogenase medium subunit